MSTPRLLVEAVPYRKEPILAFNPLYQPWQRHQSELILPEKPSKFMKACTCLLESVGSCGATPTS
jgi:hypothetical protein